MNRRALLIAEVLAALAVATVAMGVVVAGHGWRRVESAQDLRATALDVAQNRLAAWRAGRPLPADPAWTISEQRLADGIESVTVIHRSGLRLTSIRATRP